MSVLQFSQTLKCLGCDLVFTKPDNLWQHQTQTGHSEFELHHIYRFQHPRRIILQPDGKSGDDGILYMPVTES